MVNISSVLTNIMIQRYIASKHPTVNKLEKINVDLIQFLMENLEITILLQLQQKEELTFSILMEMNLIRRKVFSMDIL